MNNIEDKDNLRACTGCSICAAVCPKGAITISLNDEGFYTPAVDPQKCVECGICKHSCYKFDAEVSNACTPLACYAASNIHKEKLMNSSSGGISRLLMEEAINRGYKVFGCAYDIQKGIAISQIASNCEELDCFYGSKYVQSYTSGGFAEIINDKSSQKYAIFGTPCQIYGFSQTLKYKRCPERYLLVDIFCHGVPSIFLWQSYLAFMKQSTGCSEFDKISFRSKTYGWHEYSIDFFKGAKKFSSFERNDPFFALFFSADIMNKACYDCKVRSSVHYSDIRIGDYWGARYALNSTGVSAVLVNSKLGADFWEAIRNDAVSEHAAFEEIANAQTFNKFYTYDSGRRDFLFDGIKNEIPLSTLYVKYTALLPFKKRAKLALKSMIKLLPRKFYFLIRKILHSI